MISHNYRSTGEIHSLMRVALFGAILLPCLAAAAPALAQVAVSDDFSGPSLDTGLWTFVDPVGDCSVVQQNGVVILDVPSGADHDPWTGGNDAARILQAVPDQDFQVEFKVENLPDQKFQIVGVMFEESAGNYLRASFHHDGTSLYLFAATFVNDVATTRGLAKISAESAGWLRVGRVGTTWSLEYSIDGVFWVPSFVFDHPMTLNAVGILAGNVRASAGSPAPAYTARVDYFFDTADPIVPEDGGLIDIWPPEITILDVVNDIGSGTATVTATTSEEATTVLSYGPDPLYGTDVPGTSGDGLNHEFVLNGLLVGSEYHFSITATDTLTNVASTPDQSFLFIQIVPEITVWHGSDQRVGHLGSAQADFNVLGTVPNWEDLVAMDYSLNGGPAQPLNWGNQPDGYGDWRRLAKNGDFNVDLPISQLLPGPNTITVTSLNSYGETDTVATTVTLESGSYPFPVDIDWGTVTDPQDVGQYVDGRWGLAGNGLRTLELGYDRGFLIGDETWQDYEIVVPMTINGLEEPGPKSDTAGMGFLMRFTGHIVGGFLNWPEAQPKWGYQPFGGLGWLRWLGGIAGDPTIQFYPGDSDVSQNFGGAEAFGPADLFQTEPDLATLPFGDPVLATNFGPANIQIGETFWMKMHCQTLPNAPNGDGRTVYRFKVWPDTQPEPAAWSFEVTQESQYALRQGGVLLLAHHVDVTFGDVTVTDISGGLPNNPPVAQDDVLNVVVGQQGSVNVLANDSDSDGVLEPSTVTIVDGPLNGTVLDVDPGTGAVTYLHDGGVAVADSFTYTVEDNSGDPSDPATVRVTVLPEPLASFVSDDFNSCDLDPIWTFVNPQGDSPSPVVTGSFTGDAQVAISVPGGSSHEPFNGTLGMPYIQQAAADQDFTAVARFVSTMPDSFTALQGLLVRQDDSSWVRFDFYSNGTGGVNLYAAAAPGSGGVVTTNVAATGASTLYLRVQRAGNTWIADYSTDGMGWTNAASFNYAMTVTGVGLYAGNAGDASAPDFTTFVDYISNAGVDPVVEPDDQDTNSLALAIVGNGAVTPSPDLPTYACDEPVTLTAVPDPGWQFDGWSGDLAGIDNPAVLAMNRAKQVTATFSLATTTVVAADASGVPGLSPAQPCAAGIPVVISRDTPLDVRGFSLTLALTNLDLCGGTGSIVEGDFLGSVGTTTFNVLDNLNGTWTVDATILGDPCGATALAGTLMTLDVTHTVADGTGTIAVTGLDLRDCANGPLGAAAGPDATIRIDSTGPAAVADLLTSLVDSGVPDANTGSVDLAWTPSPDPETAEVRIYRKGFGAYPEYDDAGGAAPALPADPLAEGWTLAATVPVGGQTVTDIPPTRDLWYFAAQAVDSLGNPSPAVMGPGLLNYLLGDVSDGGAPIADGDNTVGVADLTLLGAHYGATDGNPAYLATLDIGPTDDTMVTGRPLTDNQLDFEDLILMGINFGNVLGQPAVTLSYPGVPAAAGSNVLTVHLPDLPPVGQTFAAELVMSGDGTVQGLSIPLTWDPAVVQPVSFAAGPLLAGQGGNAAVLSAVPGVIDVCLAGVRETGLSGIGTLATVTFEVLAAGQPLIALDVIDARDARNQPVVVPTSGTTAVEDLPPAVSALLPNYPNPFNPMTTIAFDLARAGRVRIDIFGVDGRRIRTLVDRDYAPGRHTAVFDGRDRAGRQLASGTYLYVMKGPGVTQTRRMLLVK